MAYIFLIFFLVILFSAHWAVYAFGLRFFVWSKFKKIVFKFVLSLLALGFVISALLTRIFDNFFTNSLYFLAGLWYGLLVQLLIAIAIFSLLRLIFYYFKKELKEKIIAGVLVSMAILLSIWGVWNAYNPAIKKLEIKIDNLPVAWQDAKVIQLSDMHLGKALGVDFAKRVVTLVNAEDSDLVLITGDLFDGMGGNTEELLNVISAIRAKHGVYFVSGNHETYAGRSEIIDAIEKSPIKVLDNKVHVVEGLEIIGIAYTTPSEDGDPVDIIKHQAGYSNDMPSILLYHIPGASTGSDSSHSSIYFHPDVSFDMARDLGVDLQLSGHVHQGQIFPFNLLAAWIYNGFDHGLHQIGDMQLYVSPGTGVWGPTMRIGSRSEITEIILH